MITLAAKGHVHELAQDFEVSDSRMYEILSTNNPYPRAKRLIRAIARVNPDGARQIKADLDAMFRQILGESEPVDLAALHKETSEALQAVLERRSVADQLQELREAEATVQSAIAAVEAGEKIC